MPDIFISNTHKDSSSAKETDGGRKSKDKPLETIHKTFKNLIDYSQSKKGSSYASYLYLPNNVGFENKEPEEKVILLLRKHPVTNLGWIAVTMLMLFAPSFLKIFPILSFMQDNYQFISVLIWYMITVAFVLEKFLTWFFNVYVVTDERIIDIDFHNLIYKEVSEAALDKIQDVNYKMGGAIRTVFNYGDVVIQTASEVPNFEFLAVPKPAKVAEIFQKLRVEEEVEKLEGRIR